MAPIKADPHLIKRFFYCFIGYFLTFFILGGFTGKKILIILSLPCSILLSVITIYIADKIGAVNGKIYWPAKKISLREQLSSDLANAKYSKGKGEFKDALNIINQALDKDSDFPDALYLKGQILWEGFEKTIESKKIFRKVIQLVPVEESLYRWSSYYIDKITAHDKMKANEFNPDKNDKI